MAHVGKGFKKAGADEIVETAVGDPAVFSVVKNERDARCAVVYGRQAIDVAGTGLGEGQEAPSLLIFGVKLLLDVLPTAAGRDPFEIVQADQGRRLVQASFPPA